MKPGELLEAINELSHERGLDPESIIEAIEDAIVGAAYRKYKNYKNIEANLNQETGEIDLMHYKLVVDKIEDADNEILLGEITKLDPLAECGDEVEYEIDASEFSNVIAQTARQLIFQKIREAERESVIQKYSDKKGEIIHGKVSRIERGGRVVLSIGNTVEAALEPREQIPFEKLQQGEHVRALLIDLNSEGRGPQLVISRTHPDFLIKLFEVEVPEVFDGIIEVVVAAREPGRRAKVAVYTNDPDVDAVGACVGMRGSRVQAIVSELCGERIDVIEWSEEILEFIANSLAPAEIVEIDLDAEKRTADIKIEPDQLSLAIGKQGQNVRLASKLTKVMINVSAWESLKALEEAEKAAQEEDSGSDENEAAKEPGTGEIEVGISGEEAEKAAEEESSGTDENEAANEPGTGEIEVEISVDDEKPESKTEDSVP